MTFTDEFNGKKTLGTVALANVDGDWMATLGVRLVGLGTHVVRATYSGDDHTATRAARRSRSR